MAQVRVDGVWCWTAAKVIDLTWSTRWPGGCWEASWTMNIPHDDVPSFKRGARVEVFDGIRVWVGTLAEPAPNDVGWEFHAVGLSRQAYHAEALDSTGAPTTEPLEAVDQAIARGAWGVTRVLPLGVGADVPVTANDTGQLNKVGALLDAYCAANGVDWGVFADGEVYVGPPPGRRWIVSPRVAVLGVADDDYVTHLHVRYVSAIDPTPPTTPTGWGHEVAVDEVAAERWGPREEHVDLSNLGLMSDTAARNHAEQRLAKVSGRLGWTNAIEASEATLLTPHGHAATLSHVRAGDEIRILGAMDIQGNLTPAPSTDVVLAEVRYVDGAPTVYLAPVGLVARDFASVLEDAAAPEKVEVEG